MAKKVGAPTKPDDEKKVAVAIMVKAKHRKEMKILLQTIADKKNKS